MRRSVCIWLSINKGLEFNKIDLNGQLFKFDWSKNFKAFLDLFLIVQIFDRFVNIVKKFNPDDAQNERNWLN